MKSLFLALLCAAGASAADAPPDPLAILLTKYSASMDEKAAASPGASEESGERLAKIQGDLSLVAVGYEVLRAPVHAERSHDAVTVLIPAELRPFFKDRDSILDAAYRTLALVDYTWALRFPEPPCSPADKRRALLRSRDGLFTDPQTGAPSPWLARLLGPASYGRSAEEALDRASAETKLSATDYERLRVREQTLTEVLSSDRAVGPARSKLYCQRAGVEEDLARAHRLNVGPTLASRALGSGEPQPGAASVYLLAVPSGKTYRALGTAFALETPQGKRIITDASLVRGRKNLVLFAPPGADGALGAPSKLVIERAASGTGLASGRVEGEFAAPALTASASPAAPGDLTLAIGHVSAAGPWTTTQGLVTAAGDGVFQTDALISAQLAGAPVLNDAGEVVGVAVLQDGAPVAVNAAVLHRFVDGADAAVNADAAMIAARATGSGSILTAVRSMDQYKVNGPGGQAIESGLPTSLGGVNWEGGGGVGGFRPTGYAGPPSGYSAYGGSGYNSGGFEDRVGADLGNAMADVAVAGVGALFRGMSKMFSGNPNSSAPTRRAEPKKPAPPTQPPPPPEPKIIGLTLTASPARARPGELVRLTAQLQFQGDYKNKSGIVISFDAAGQKADFGKTGITSALATTSAGGSASTVLTLAEDVAVEAQGQFSDLDRRASGNNPVFLSANRPSSNVTPIRRVKDSARNELDSLDAEEAQSAPDADEAAIPGADESSAGESVTAPVVDTIVKASAAGFTDRATIRGEEVKPVYKYKLVVAASSSDIPPGGHASITARIDTDDPSFNIAGRKIRFTFKPGDGDAGEFEMPTSFDGVATIGLAVAAGPTPAMAGRAFGTGRKIIETGDSLVPAANFMCVLAGVSTSLKITAVFAEASIGTLAPEGAAAGMLGGLAVTIQCTIVVNGARSDGRIYNKPPKDAKDSNGAKAPGKPGADEGFADPKAGENWGKTASGDRGWVDANGDIWVPTGQGPEAHGGPHWDVQDVNGKNHRNVYPGGTVR